LPLGINFPPELW